MSIFYFVKVNGRGNSGRTEEGSWEARWSEKQTQANGTDRASGYEKEGGESQVNRYATPALQRLSPEFAAAAEADRVAHASLLGRYASPVLERTDGILGGVGGLAHICGLLSKMGAIVCCVSDGEPDKPLIETIPALQSWQSHVQNAKTLVRSPSETTLRPQSER